MAARLLDLSTQDLMRRFVETKTLPRSVDPAPFVESIVEAVSRETFRKARKTLSPEDSFYDRLLELSLCRLDVLSREKGLFISFFDAMRRSPTLMIPFLRFFRSALHEMILAAAEPLEVPLPFLFSPAFALVFSLALQRWRTTDARNPDALASCLDSGMNELFKRFSIQQTHAEAGLP